MPIDGTLFEIHGAARPQIDHWNPKDGRIRIRIGSLYLSLPREDAETLVALLSSELIELDMAAIDQGVAISPVTGRPVTT